MNPGPTHMVTYLPPLNEELVQLSSFVALLKSGIEVYQVVILGKN